MKPKPQSVRRALIRDVAFFQFKLLLDAVRDLALSPLSLAAALLDLLLSGVQPPQYFRAVLRLGERSEQWIDLWSAGRGAKSHDHMNVDALLTHVETVVSDPKSGAKRARVLKRWAERELARARREKQQGIASASPDNLEPPDSGSA
ncbi:MAG TPA: hypothetical protein VFN25_05275 [Dokdonella sp.]|uniref:hypothetical protein n=1 Tax=Dokdonella sp. TaxID=2291710 RepID=UPI002D7FB4CB|nr:hypothetical protein [Dokdonella sp.]HET9032301.1 hypothetical protein [Dokdonella sp.]